jgi:hypothetical protein
MRKSELTVAFLLILLAARQWGLALPWQQDSPRTWQSKEHSKRFDHYKTGKKLAQLAAESKTEEVEVNMGALPELATIANRQIPSYPSPFLRRSACGSDAILLGTVTSQAASETDTGEFVFTEVRFAVKDVLKDNSLAPIPLNTEVIIVRPGGSIQIGNRTVRATDPFFPGFEDHAQYLLFLRYLPETGSFQAYGIGSYVVRGNRVFLLTVRPALGKRKFQAEDISGFLAEVRDAIRAPCEEVLP